MTTRMLLELGLSLAGFAVLVYWIAAPRSSAPPRREPDAGFKPRGPQPWENDNSRGRGNR